MKFATQISPLLDSSPKLAYYLGTQSNTLCSGFVDKTLSWGFWKLFPTGAYAIIGITCVEFENVMKSTMKKKKKKHIIWGFVSMCVLIFVFRSNTSTLVVVLLGDIKQDRER